MLATQTSEGEENVSSSTAEGEPTTPKMPVKAIATSSVRTQENLSSPFFGKRIFSFRSAWFRSSY